MAKKSGSKSKKAAKPDKDQPIESTGGAGLTAEDLPYRPCVGIALFSDDGQVWIGNRIGFEGAWQLPQGGIDGGERGGRDLTDGLLQQRIVNSALGRRVVERALAAAHQ